MTNKFREILVKLISDLKHVEHHFVSEELWRVDQALNELDELSLEQAEAIDCGCKICDGVGCKACDARKSLEQAEDELPNVEKHIEYAIDLYANKALEIDEICKQVSSEINDKASKVIAKKNARIAELEDMVIRTEKVAKLQSLDEEAVTRVLIETKELFDSMPLHKQESLPVAGPRLFAQAICSKFRKGE